MRLWISIFALATLVSATGALAFEPLFDTRLDYYAGEHAVAKKTLLLK